VTNAGNRSRERMTAMIQDDLKKIGIRVTLAPIDFPSLIGRITRNFEYDACLLGLVMTDLDPIAQSQVWLSSGPQHQWNPGQAKPETEWEAEIDRHMRLLATGTTFAARKQAFDRVQQIASEMAPFIYLVHRHALVAVSSAVRGVEPSVLRPQTLWNADRIWIASGTQVSQR
jgi:peptide/nickel transport system substrate-binding protein